MPTSKTRINISLSESVQEILAKSARKDRIPAATKAARLLETALEIEEDQAWDAIAQKRDVTNAKFLSHDKAWN